MNWSKKLILETGWVNFIALILVSLTGISWTTWLCLNSTGTPVQDEIGHLLIAKHAWIYPQWLLDIWGRPVNTLIYMLPAPFGLTAARLFSIVLAIFTSFFTLQIARALGLRQIFWVALFLWFQPWFNALSFTAITEVPFSLFLVIGIYLALKNQDIGAAFLFGSLPLIRHEGIALLGVWLLYLLIRKQWHPLILSILPFTVYNLVYLLAFAKPAISIFTNINPTNLYGRGDWLHFVNPTLKSVGITVILLAMISLLQWKEWRWKVLVFTPYMLYFLLQTVIFRFGLYASGGYQLFLLPLAPAFAIAAGSGLQVLFDWLSHRAVQIKLIDWQRNGLLVLIGILVSFFVLKAGFGSQPYTLISEELAARDAASWLRQNIPYSHKVISTHVWFHYFYNIQWSRGEMWIPKPNTLNNLGPGDVVVWDAHYSDRWGINQSVLDDPTNGWQRLAEFENGLVMIYGKPTQ